MSYAEVCERLNGRASYTSSFAKHPLSLVHKPTDAVSHCTIRASDISQCVGGRTTSVCCTRRNPSATSARLAVPGVFVDATVNKVCFAHRCDTISGAVYVAHVILGKPCSPRVDLGVTTIIGTAKASSSVSSAVYCLHLL